MKETVQFFLVSAFSPHCLFFSPFICIFWWTAQNMQMARPLDDFANYLRENVLCLSTKIYKVLLVKYSTLIKSSYYIFVCHFYARALDRNKL